MDKKTKKITIKEIAKLAEVSTQTVSRVLNKKFTSVNENTREKIEKIIGEQGYKPNLIARGLKQNKMNLIGVIVPDIGNPAWSEVVKGISTGLTEEEYLPILFNTNENEKTELEFLEKVSSMLISGVLLIPSHLESRDYELLNEVNHPLVIVDRLIPGIKKDCIIFNNYKSAYDATNYLIRKGHKKIVILNGDVSLYSSKSRYRGWKKAMEENGLYDSEYELWGSFSIDSGYKMMKDIINRVSCSAIFAGNDLIAIGAKKAIEEEDMKIPDDVSIMGFDDIFSSSYLNPPLTTVRVPFYDLGLQAAFLIVERIKNPNEDTKQVKLNCQLIERYSVKNIK